MASRRGEGPLVALIAAIVAVTAGCARVCAERSSRTSGPVPPSAHMPLGSREVPVARPLCVSPNGRRTQLLVSPDVRPQDVRLLLQALADAGPLEGAVALWVDDVSCARRMKGTTEIRHECNAAGGVPARGVVLRRPRRFRCANDSFIPEGIERDEPTLSSSRHIRSRSYGRASTVTWTVLSSPTWSELAAIRPTSSRPGERSSESTATEACRFGAWESRSFPGAAPRL